MNKAELIQIIIYQLEEKLRIAHASTQRAIDAATDEETVPEHKYDTLALEASYLAHGQAMRVQESEGELRQYRSMVIRDFTDAPIGVGAYVVLVDENNIKKTLFHRSVLWWTNGGLARSGSLCLNSEITIGTSVTWQRGRRRV